MFKTGRADALANRKPNPEGDRDYAQGYRSAVRTLEQLLDLWETPKGRPVRINLYNPHSGCACAMGELLVAFRPQLELTLIATLEAVHEVARLLNISHLHATLLYVANDGYKHNPADVLRNPEKILGEHWSKILDLWAMREPPSFRPWTSRMDVSRLSMEARQALYNHPWHEHHTAAIVNGTCTLTIPPRPANYGVISS